MKNIVKNSVSVIGATLLMASMANAYDSTGCGMGSLAWQGERGKIPQILAVTTNGTFGAQTFGISSGTSGCDPNGTITGGTRRMAVTFLENNLDQFALDASRGEGETIDTLAGILKVDSKFLGEKTKENFAYIFDNEDVQVLDVALKVFEIANA